MIKKDNIAALNQCRAQHGMQIIIYDYIDRYNYLSFIYFIFSELFSKNKIFRILKVPCFTHFQIFIFYSWTPVSSFSRLIIHLYISPE